MSRKEEMVIHNLISALPSNIQMTRKTFQKMIFLSNAIENGWKIYKDDDKYIFTKKHENLREVYDEKYLENFIMKNISYTLPENN